MILQYRNLFPIWCSFPGRKIVEKLASLEEIIIMIFIFLKVQLKI